MDLYILIIGLCLCLLTTSIFLHFKLIKGGINALLLKIVASFTFIISALLLCSAKNGANNYANITISCLSITLVCMLVSDILQELKITYPFHERKYALASSIGNIVANVFSIASIVFIANNTIDLFSSTYLLPLILILVGAIILTTIIYFVFTKAIKLDLKVFKVQTIFNYFVLFLTTILSIYLAFININLSSFILAIAFVLLIISNILQTIQNYQENETNKYLLPSIIIYYLSQALIVLFIYLV